VEPIFDSTTHYRIEVRGHIDIEWLRSLQGPVEISVADAGQRDQIREDSTVFEVSTDQAGVIGLVRTLHSLGVTIQQFAVVRSL
jgi:hypothetical protein